jgi:hypothetical protein
VYLVGMYIYWS